MEIYCGKCRRQEIKAIVDGQVLQPHCGLAHANYLDRFQGETMASINAALFQTVCMPELLVCKI